MPIITAKRDTFVKRSPDLLEDPSLPGVLRVQSSSNLAVLRGCKAENGHYLCHFASAVGSIGEFGYVLPDDWEIPIELRNPKIRLAVPHFDQTNNSEHLHGPGSRQCCLTSNAMLADYLLDGFLSKRARNAGYREPESVYGEVLARFGDTTDHSANTKALRELGIDSYFSYSISPLDVLQSLTLGVPVVAGMAYKASGHIVLIVGRNEEKGLWDIHCPYGVRRGSSDTWLEIGGHSGKHDQFSDATMDKLLWDQRRTPARECGWGRIVTAIRSEAGGWEPTGLPKGL